MLTTPRTSRPALLLASAAALGLLTVVAGAERGDLIGTLPVVYGTPPTAQPQRPYGLGSDPDASLVLGGSFAALTTGVRNASGQGWIQAQPGDGPDEWTWTVHGDTVLYLDRDLLESGALTLRLLVGTDKLGGVGLASVGGRVGSPFVLDAPRIDLPAAELIAGSMLEHHPLTLDLASRDGDWAHCELQVGTDSARLELFDL